MIPAALKTEERKRGSSAAPTVCAGLLAASRPAILHGTEGVVRLAWREAIFLHSPGAVL